MKNRKHCNAVITLSNLHASFLLQSSYSYYHSTDSLRSKHVKLLSKINNLNFSFKYKVQKNAKKKQKERSTVFLHWNILPVQHIEKVRGHWTNMSLFCCETVSADLGT